MKKIILILYILIFALSLLFVSAESYAADQTKTGSENSFLNINCNNENIQIKSVRYGKGILNNECPAVRLQCNNKLSCNFKMSNANCGGDPVKFVVKDWTVVYTCGSSPTPTPIPPPIGGQFTASARENSLISLSCSSGGIAVKGSSYGSGNKIRSCDGLASACNNKNSCSIKVTNTLCGGDPVPNIVKTLTVGYDCSGTIAPTPPPCTPKTCSQLGKQCGSWPDGCGSTVNCPTCPSGKSCSNGQCISNIPACTNECSSGQRICSGNGYKICGNYDSDSCLEWSSVQSCSSGQSCSNGQCQTSSTGLRQCSGYLPSENVIRGPFQYSVGYSPASWTYSENTDETTPCLWKCANGHYLRYQPPYFPLGYENEKNYLKNRYLYPPGQSTPYCGLINDGNAILGGGNDIVIQTYDSLAGAIGSLRWHGKEFIDMFDHGRELQSSTFFDTNLYVDCLNPTEAGNEANGLGTRPSSSVLQYLTTSENKLRARTQMAWWRGCSTQQFSTLPISSYSPNHFLDREVTIGFRDMPHVIEYKVAFDVPKDYGQYYFEILTGYMTPIFSEFWTYDPKTKTLAELSSSPELQEFPIIFTTPDHNYAMGIYAPDPWLWYGRWRFLTEFSPTVKWNVVIKGRNIKQGRYPFTVFPVVGAFEDVKSSMDQLHEYFKDYVSPHPPGTVTPPSCVPKTCSQLDKQCGSWPNGCGGTVVCPACPSGQSCSNGICSGSSNLLWIKADDGTSDGIITDSSGNNINGNCNGNSCPTFISNSKVNGAYSFDGNDFIDFGNRFNVGTSDFSLEAWIRTTTSNAGTILGKMSTQGSNYPAYVMDIYNGRLRTFLVTAESNYIGDESYGPVNDGNWHHVVYSVNRNGNANLYVDGILRHSRNIATHNNENINNDWNFYIGKRYSGVHFTGEIDEIKFYTKALTAEEVISSYCTYSMSDPNCQDGIVTFTTGAFFPVNEGLISEIYLKKLFSVVHNKIYLLLYN